MSLPPEFKPTYEPARSYLVRGDLLNALIRQSHDGRLIAGRGIREVATPSGRVWLVEPPGQSTAHPFQLHIVQDDGPKLQVQWGECCGTLPTVDSAGNIQLVPLTMLAVFDSSTALVGDPAPPYATVGQASLSSGSTYGVWLKATTGTDQLTGYAPPRDTASDTVDALHLGAGGVAEILVTTDYPDYNDIAALVASTENFIYRYIGKVAVSAEGEVTVQQWLRSNVQFPGFMYPKQIISTDVGNEIVRGSDGGVFYEAP